MADEAGNGARMAYIIGIGRSYVGGAEPTRALVFLLFAGLLL